MLVSCVEEELDLGTAEISVNPSELTFTEAEGSTSFSLFANRDWIVSGVPDWLALSQEKGEAGTKSQTVTLSVNPNDGNNRSAVLVFNIGYAKATLNVTQTGPKGEVNLGDGSKDNPYTVAGVLEYIDSLGADVESPKSIYIQGVVSNVVTTYAASGDFGNATFYIVDAENDAKSFYVYQTYYLGNRKWQSGDKEVQAGDKVIVCGKVVNYKGNTPETVGKGGSFVYSLNGETAGGEPVEQGEAKGSGTLDDPYNPQGAAEYAISLGTDVESPQSVYIKGKISKVTTTYAASGTYGNATFTIVDVETGLGEFYVFQTYYLGNRKWQSGDTDVKVGDEVIVCGKVVNFKGNTPETVGKGNSYVYSLNGQTEGTPVTPPATGDPAGTGTANDPFNVAAAIAKAQETGETATTESYYIKGTVTGKPDLSAQYKNATFKMVDVAGGAEFTAFRIKSFDGGDITGSEPIKAGDVVVVYGQIVNYKSNTPETTQGGTLISWNGQTSFEGYTPPDNPGDSGDYASNVQWTLGDYSYNQEANVNNTTGVAVLKLGTSSKYGQATLTIPSGATKLSLYALSWKGVAVADLVFTDVTGAEVAKVTPASNDTLSGNPTYNLTVSDSDKYEITIPAGTTSLVVSTSGGYRAVLFGINAE